MKLVLDPCAARRGGGLSRLIVRVVWHSLSSLRHLALSGLLASPALALTSEEQSAICDRAAAVATAQTGVPIAVLRAITLTETGRTRDGRTRPWPWTVNMEGKGVWFDTEDAARAYAYEHYKRGARSFDVGCFQINYKWHHEAFSSIEEMFEPNANALYAAQFLLELHSETGSWDDAAGAYHSRTPEFANRYIERFASFRAQLESEGTQNLLVATSGPAYGFSGREDEDPSGDSDASALRQLLPRVNTYPLLQSGGDTAIGSLVPLGVLPRAAGLFGRDDAG